MVKPSHIAVVLGIMRKVSLQRNPTHIVSVVKFCTSLYLCTRGKPSVRKQSVKDFAYPSSLFEVLKDLLKGVYDYNKGLGTNFSQHTFSHTLFILEKKV